MRRLDIYWDNQRAGCLEEWHPSLYRFSYDPAYLQTSLPPVSLTMPKRIEPYISKVLFPCFSNLLPEGANRKTICRKQHIDERDAMGLLMTFVEKDIIGNLELRDVDENY